jgi:hypothetical protein
VEQVVWNGCWLTGWWVVHFRFHMPLLCRDAFLQQVKN